MKTAQIIAEEKVNWINSRCHHPMGYRGYQLQDIQQAIIEAIEEDREQIKEMVYKVNNPFTGELLKEQYHAAEMMKGLVAGMIYELNQSKFLGK